MSRDSTVKLVIIVVELALVAALMVSRGLTVAVGDLGKPVGFALLLLVVALFYQKRKVSSFVMCLLGLTHVVVFTAGYTLLMYSVSTLNAPLVDQQLMNFDKACGVSLPAIVEWAKANPGITGWLQLTYDSLLIQTALVVTVLGMRGKRVPMEQFVMQFILSTLIVLLALTFAPALGPFHAYGYELNGAQERYMEHFTALRDGSMTRLTLSEAEGLITFPSFHTTWAIILAWAYRRDLLLFVPLSLVNLAVIFSTLTTGWHYFADVVGGVLVAVVVIWLTNALKPWFYDENEEPRMVGSRNAAGPDVPQT